MDPSFQGESSFDQRIVSRVQAAVQNLTNAKEQIREGIRGDTDGSLTRVLVGIIEKVEEQIEQILQEIAEITEEDVKINRSGRMHRNLEQFLFDIDLIRAAAFQIPIELYYLTKTSFRDLGHEDVNIVLIPGASLGTTNLSDAFMSLFDFSDNILAYINSAFPFYWIILVPPSFTRTPLNWPLIVHEIGHILERQKWQLVGKYYEYPIVPSLFDRDMKSYYAQEFQADFVAVSYFGPVFARRLLEIYYTREFMISITHPSWRERFEAIADELENAGFSTEATALKEVSKREKPSMISRDSVEHLCDILFETKTKLSGSTCVYTKNNAGENKARSRLERFAPYTDDMRTLLNVADNVLQNKLQSESDPTKKRNVEKDFNYLLEDSIRLSYTKDIVQPV